MPQCGLLPKRLRGFSALFHRFHLVELQLHRGLTAEHGYHNPHAVFLSVQLFHSTHKALQRPVDNLDGIADGVGHLYDDNGVNVRIVDGGIKVGVDLNVVPIL